ncbi:capsule biosynthesis GfcC family protein [Pseudomonas extremaustralis]|uniref:capsule biosynthesis GfcC family protein n=1 Tax=Pseudomonas extremaustralis TaxID=359110 RepID=UPI0021CA91BE|nr:capsule biosynthesis GfcC family protein [Pseudomonas extremaustralis]MDG2969556.1 capsule biosynthesis GfcC family protein [Pseudomonas extremaustralis]UUJ41266.1 capsule biosynthesis GfcC family protein [Pseudomonas extremaustralis]
MTVGKLAALALLCGCAPLCLAAAVSVSGQVAHPGTVALQPEARLLDVLTASQPDAQGYWLGAAWLHQPLLERQTRLKAGVLFDLDTLRRVALAAGREGRARVATQLYEQVQALPVTGRRLTPLDPVAVEVGFAPNPSISAGDRLVYPPRPDYVRVLGAVATACTLAFQPMQRARDYLRACPPGPQADADYLWLIQPDGHVTRLGNAPWNREEGAPPAPGSTLLVPIRSDDLDPPTPELNQQLAEFIATQPLAEITP